MSSGRIWWEDLIETTQKHNDNYVEVDDARTESVLVPCSLPSAMAPSHRSESVANEYEEEVGWFGPESVDFSNPPTESTLTSKVDLFIERIKNYMLSRQKEERDEKKIVEDIKEAIKSAAEVQDLPLILNVSSTQLYEAFKVARINFVELKLNLTKEQIIDLIRLKRCRDINAIPEFNTFKPNVINIYLKKVARTNYFEIYIRSLTVLDFLTRVWDVAQKSQNKNSNYILNEAGYDLDCTKKFIHEYFALDVKTFMQKLLALSRAQVIRESSSFIKPFYKFNEADKRELYSFFTLIEKENTSVQQEEAAFDHVEIGEIIIPSSISSNPTIDPNLFRQVEVPPVQSNSPNVKRRKIASVVSESKDSPEISSPTPAAKRPKQQHTPTLEERKQLYIEKIVEFMYARQTNTSSKDDLETTVKKAIQDAKRFQDLQKILKVSNLCFTNAYSYAQIEFVEMKLNLTREQIVDLIRMKRCSNIADIKEFADIFSDYKVIRIYLSNVVRKPYFSIYLESIPVREFLQTILEAANRLNKDAFQPVMTEAKYYHAECLDDFFKVHFKISKVKFVEKLLSLSKEQVINISFEEPFYRLTEDQKQALVSSFAKSKKISEINSVPILTTSSTTTILSAIGSNLSTLPISEEPSVLQVARTNAELSENILENEERYDFPTLNKP